MIGVSGCSSDKKISLEQQICYLVDKVNELIEKGNLVIENQKTLDDNNNAVFTAMQLWQNSQLSYLNGIVMKSPNGTRYKLSVGDDGTLKTEKVV